MTLLTLFKASSSTPDNPNPLTPAQRQRFRITRGFEIVYSEMGNGSLFTWIPGNPQYGSIAYGIFRWYYNINQSILDSGVQTQDKYLASALRSLGIYTETVL